MEYKAVIFDLDGTLLDTLEDLADSLNRVLHNRGLPTHPTEAFRYFVGSGAAMLVSRALPLEKRNDELAADCLEAFLYLGDSDIDMRTAVDANMFPVGAKWGFRSEKELREAGAIKIIGRPTELLELF